jgi:uncharacterized protein (TIGR02266 family)
MLKVEYPNLDEFAIDYLLNISEGGVFIITELPFTKDQEVDFAISFPGLLEPIALQGIVRRVALEPERVHRGIGIEFKPLVPEVRTKIKKLVEIFQANNQIDFGQKVDPDREFVILVVDDNRLIVNLFCYALYSMKLSKRIPQGSRIITASDGIQALEIISNQKIDFVILDNYLPGINGIEILKKMRADPELSQIPVIMISADNPELKSSSLDNGASMFLTKPLQAKKLEITMSDLFPDYN